MRPETLDDWRHLTARGVVEKEFTWPRDRRLLYFRDPAGNSVELVTPGLWARRPGGRLAVTRSERITPTPEGRHVIHGGALQHPGVGLHHTAIVRGRAGTPPAALAADVLCLQEVEPDVFASLTVRLEPLGYAGYYEQKGRNRPDGCATLVRAGAFAVRHAHRLEYRDRESGAEGHSGHVALLLALERGGHLLGVANTHVRWAAPGRPRGEQVGYRQVAELIDACRRFDPPCRDWVVCGDFNYTPDAAAVGAMRDTGYAFAHADRPALRSAVANGRAKLIDYVFRPRGCGPSRSIRRPSGTTPSCPRRASRPTT